MAVLPVRSPALDREPLRLPVERLRLDLPIPVTSFTLSVVAEAAFSIALPAASPACTIERAALPAVLPTLAMLKLLGRRQSRLLTSRPLGRRGRRLHDVCQIGVSGR